MKKIVMIGPCPSKRGEIEPRKSVDRPESPKESRKMRMIKRVGVEKTVPGKEEGEVEEEEEEWEQTFHTWNFLIFCHCVANILSGVAI